MTFTYKSIEYVLVTWDTKIGAPISTKADPKLKDAVTYMSSYISRVQELPGKAIA